MLIGTLGYYIPISYLVSLFHTKIQIPMRLADSEQSDYGYSYVKQVAQWGQSLTLEQPKCLKIHLFMMLKGR